MLSKGAAVYSIVQLSSFEVYALLEYKYCLFKEKCVWVAGNEEEGSLQRFFLERQTVAAFVALNPFFSAFVWVKMSAGLIRTLRNMSRIRTHSSLT